MSVDGGSLTRQAPSATVSCTATYVGKQSDVDAGHTDTTVLSNARRPTACPVNANSDLVVAIPQHPSVSVVKSSDATATTGTGNTITYSYLVTNTGNVTIKIGRASCREGD